MAAKFTAGTTDNTMNELILRLAASRFLTASLMIHLILVSVLGSYVLFKGAHEASAFEVASDGFLQDFTLAQEQDVVQEFEEPVPSEEIEPVSISSQSLVSALTDTSAGWVTSASMDRLSIGNSLIPARNLPLGSPGASGAGVRSGLDGSSGGKMRGTLFGVNVETAKLGIILDVSGSAHPHLLNALSEIEKNFKKATIVLYPGCGMADGLKSRDYQIVTAQSVWNRFKDDAADTETIFGQIATWSAKYPNQSERIQRLLKSDDVYVLVNEPSIKQTRGCQYAFQCLIDNGVDTIYWFADFGDTIVPEEAKSVARKLKAKQIKVIAHNFAGKPVNEGGILIVKRTDGETISKIPGK